MNTEPTYPIDLITSYFAGESNSEDLAFLAAWLKADPKHREFFESFRKTWSNLEKHRIESQVDLDIEWQELKEKTNFSSSGTLKSTLVSSETTGFKRVFTPRVFRIAALVLLFAIPTAFLYFYFARSELKKLNADIAIVEGILPDGTTVTLNAGSSIEYPSRFRTHERDVTLTGEAYFEVAHDKTKPFIITAGNVRVEVLGTSFYVNTHELSGKMQVILTSGQVAIYYNDNATERVILAPGEKADISVDQHGIFKTDNEDPNFLSWKTQNIIFNNAPLADVVEILNKTYHVRIRITNPGLAQCRITATFDNQSIESVLNVLSATLNVKIIQNGSWTEISGNGCD